MIKLLSKSVLVLGTVLTLTACGGSSSGSKPAAPVKAPDTGSGAKIFDSLVRTFSIQNEECPNGGIEIEMGIDSNSNGRLDSDEVDQARTQTVCHGANGSSGEDGKNSLILITQPTIEECPEGGRKIVIGLDQNSNGVLDAEEVSQVELVCNQTAQLNSLVSTSAEPAGNNCVAGGVRIDSGLDINNDQILAAGEIEATSYVCSGVSITDGTDTPNITASGFVLPEDAIYVLPNAVDGTDLKNAIITALTDTPDNAVIVLPAGNFIVSSSITITDATGITITGYGMDATILNFSTAPEDDGFKFAGGNDITIRDLAVYEAPKNAIKADGVNGIHMTYVAAVWQTDLEEGGSNNGAYGLYPVSSQNVLMENNYAKGSADAGIYVGQSNNIIVRNNIAEHNVAGIEIENSNNADVYNNVAFDNAAGILSFDLPGLPQAYGRGVRIFNNNIYANNTTNVGAGAVSLAPSGTGVLIFATSDVEIYKNTISDNDTAGIEVASYFLADGNVSNYSDNYASTIANGWNPLIKNINIHHNTFKDNSLLTPPKTGLLEDILKGYQYGFNYTGSLQTAPAIIYDGIGELLSNAGQLMDFNNLVGSDAASDGVNYNPYGAADAICVAGNINNNTADDLNVGMVYGTDPTDPDNWNEDQAAAEATLRIDLMANNTLLNCTQDRLAPAVVTIKGNVYGCTADDAEVEACALEEPVVDICTQEVVGVNWEALLTENCTNLSDYNLFSDAADPTSGPNSNGLPYDLSTSLFTDYASKYRFVFVPEGKVATYSEHEVIEFPIGSVLVKTFSMPADTANRGVNETNIETRLLIHRADGWNAIPYYWDSAADASYIVTGKIISDVTITHKGAPLTFDYGIPQKSQCTNCHAVAPVLDRNDPTDKRKSIFKPIGLKARFLNVDYDYAGGTENQLAHWQSAGILTSVPVDNTAIASAPIFTDTTDITALTTEELNIMARGYLDINCAHCHRDGLTIPEANYTGAAGDSGLTLEFNRDINTDPSKFGVCKTAVAGGYPADNMGYNQYPRDVIPEHADRSYLLYRMNTNDGRHKMPELGRGSIHTEGVELIRGWINSLDANNCGLTDLIQ